MNLYYLNQKVNALRLHARNSKHACWTLGELLHEAEMKGYLIEQDRISGHITIIDKRGDV